MSRSKLFAADQLRNTIPKDVLVRPDVVKDALASHPGIEVKALEESEEVRGSPAEYIGRFLDARAPALETVIYSAIGVHKPS